MKHGQVVAEQFDRSAEEFAAWSVTRDERMLRGLADFCGLTAVDEVLDVACGTGAFALYAAEVARSVIGVDLSAGMIAVAERRAAEQGLRNAAFVRCDVGRLDLADGLFSVVASRSAFHHMPQYDQVFAEMVRCCRPGGAIVLQDVTAYGDQAVDDFFERLEHRIDRSHHLTRSKRELFDLFGSQGVGLEALFESESLLDFSDYVGHVAQDDESRADIERMLADALAHPELATWFVRDGERLLWRRKVCTIKGRKSGAA